MLKYIDFSAAGDLFSQNMTWNYCLRTAGMLSAGPGRSSPGSGRLSRAQGGTPHSTLHPSPKTANTRPRSGRPPPSSWRQSPGPERPPRDQGGHLRTAGGSPQDCLEAISGLPSAYLWHLLGQLRTPRRPTEISHPHRDHCRSILSELSYWKDSYGSKTSGLRRWISYFYNSDCVSSCLNYKNSVVMM